MFWTEPTFLNQIQSPHKPESKWLKQYCISVSGQYVTSDIVLVLVDNT